MPYGTIQADKIQGSINSFSPDSAMFRNRIINGAMVIDQRNAGAAVTSNGAFPVDRFTVSNGTDGAFSAQQDSSVPAGFTKSTKITITTADTSLAATQNLSFLQRIEGYNIADLNWGSANAKTVTLSFWVRSSLTGTFGGALRNNDTNRSYPYTYSISVADTWEYKTVTITGDTSGTWATDNNTGINLIFGLGAGVDRSGTAGAWNSNTNSSATGAVSVVGTNGATWYVTGVQLEVGSTATSFDYRPYGTELALCQRYYYSYILGNDKPFGTGFSYNTTRVFGSVLFPVTMRTAPTISTVSSSGYYGFYGNNTSYNFSAPFLYKSDTTNYLFEGTITGGTTGVGGLFLSQNAGASIAFSSEL